MRLKYFLPFLLLWVLTSFCNAQKLILTHDGLCSSVNTNLNYAEYISNSNSHEQMYDYCSNLLSKVEFLQYNIETFKKDRIIINGFIDGNSLLIFGKSEIQFKLYLNFEDNKIKVNADLSKTNGKELNYNILFTKKGKVRLSAPKKKIENEINGLITKIIGNIVTISQ